MCKMVKHSFWPRQQPSLVRVVLCILVVCLSAHFMVDNLHLQDLGVLGPASESTGVPDYAEIDHQDDLVIQASPPARIMDGSISPSFEWTFTSEKQPPFPFFPPPQN
jgi:hypothetical protein